MWSLTKYPGGLVSQPRGQGQVEELLPQPGVPPLLLLDHDEDDHPECVEEDQEARTQTWSNIITLSLSEVRA